MTFLTKVIRDGAISRYYTTFWISWVQALEAGDAVMMFPEGMSRFHPTIAPMKTGGRSVLQDFSARTHAQQLQDWHQISCLSTGMILTSNSPYWTVLSHICRSSSPSQLLVPNSISLFQASTALAFRYVLFGPDVLRLILSWDVLVTWHPPLTFTPKQNPELLKPVDFEAIRTVMSKYILRKIPTRLENNVFIDKIYQQISSGTYDSPSWHLVQLAKLAARMYAPLGMLWHHLWTHVYWRLLITGTTMSLGDHVRITRTFLEAFKDVHEDNMEENEQPDPDILKVSQLQTDLTVCSFHNRSVERG